MIVCSFSFTHPDFLWLFCHRFVRKNANPYRSFSLHMTGHCDPGRFNLPARNSTVFKRFETEATKGNITSLPGNATVPALLLLPVLRAFWL
jgi:hypothetical protein